jgi:hypothetical protein
MANLLTKPVQVTTNSNLSAANRYSNTMFSFILFVIYLTTLSVAWNGSKVVEGHAVAQAVRRWLPTAAARVRVRAACRVCGGQNGTWAGFLRVLRFPLPIIPPISPSL